MFDRAGLFERGGDFFAQQGSAVMKLTPAAAKEVCRAAFGHGILVMRVEGGIWHNPGFEARGDCIWDGLDPPVPASVAEDNNRQAGRFVEEESAGHSAFIITGAPFVA